MALNYHALDADQRSGWILEETQFHPDTQGKCESIMCIGNGYLGARAATEEVYVGQVRNTFVAGTFNRFHSTEVTELPNAPDVFFLDIRVGQDRFSLLEGTVENYSRRLNLARGELIREVHWTSPKGHQLQLVFRRFASMNDPHLVCTRVAIKALDSDIELQLTSGIDGQQTNSGTQHFVEGEGRIHDGQILEYLSTTSESGIHFFVQASHKFHCVSADTGRQQTKISQAPRLERRQVVLDVALAIQHGDEFVFEKQARIHTSLDRENGQNRPLNELREYVKQCSLRDSQLSYKELLVRSSSAWADIWQDIDVVIRGNIFDQLAIRFAMYHMTICTPAHDQRFGIAAKGLSGEGYKGHSFWDSEIFILPFFIFVRPDLARGLLAYRYHTLTGARDNAMHRGYKGAMYAWESATTGREVTPAFGAVDIHTGRATRVWSGEIEQHITADVAFAVWNYYRATGDLDFMDAMGFEIIFETATFWCSRLEWLEDRELWGIRDVVGPDEYKEHVDNNAFTNHMAEHNISLAVDYYEHLAATRPQVIEDMETIPNLEKDYYLWKERIGKIYLPRPRKQDGLLPQDDSYLTKREIDLTLYRSQAQVGSLFKDFNLDQVNGIQVSKQADVIALFWLLRHRFDDAALRTNWDYYEPKTLHDSSLSLAVHVCVATELGDTELAYPMFEKAARIDLGPSMKSSNHGIHAAAMGGIWQATVCGFGGLRVTGDTLDIRPSLPSAWSAMAYSLHWRGCLLTVEIRDEQVTVSRKTGAGVIQVVINGESYQLGPEEVIHA